MSGALQRAYEGDPRRLDSCPFLKRTKSALSFKIKSYISYILDMHYDGFLKLNINISSMYTCRCKDLESKFIVHTVGTVRFVSTLFTII